MIYHILFMIHYAVLLLFGVLLSSAFSGIRLNRPNILRLIVFFCLCGIVQFLAFLLTDEGTIWKLYPLITHIPLVIFLCSCFHRHCSTALASVSSAYLLCQPAKWLGLLSDMLTNSELIGRLVQIGTLIAVGIFALLILAPSISAIFNKKTKNVLIFGMIPIIYYLFDYSMGIYTDFWVTNNRVAAEFLPFFLSIVYIFFCIIYYNEYEQKADAERNEQIIRIMLAQQTKELEALKRSEQEIRILRHDMRLHLNNISLSLEHGDLDTAQKTISSLSAQADSTAIHRYCEAAAVNYILSDYAAKCKKEQILFSATVRLTEPITEEVMFASILSNALENAYHAQMDLPVPQRAIKLLLKHTEKKLLLSIKNPVYAVPVFSDGLPVSNKPGHGYGTQSIRYMAERLGGDCQFTIEDHTFILRVVI